MGQMVQTSVGFFVVVARAAGLRLFRGNRICRAGWIHFKVLTDQSNDGLVISEKTTDPDQELIDAYVGHYVYHLLIIRSISQ
jgi:hypothetical protein